MYKSDLNPGHSMSSWWNMHSLLLFCLTFSNTHTHQETEPCIRTKTQWQWTDNGQTPWQLTNTFFLNFPRMWHSLFTPSKHMASKRPLPSILVTWAYSAKNKTEHEMIKFILNFFYFIIFMFLTLLALSYLSACSVALAGFSHTLHQKNWVWWEKLFLTTILRSKVTVSYTIGKLKFCSTW